jgi:hypothetical protein
MPQDDVPHEETPIQPEEAVQREFPDAKAEESALIEFARE